MKKNDLLRQGDDIVRVLVLEGEMVLVIDCVRRTMPKWCRLDELGVFKPCTENDSSEKAGISSPYMETLGQRIAAMRINAIH